MLLPASNIQASPIARLTLQSQPGDALVQGGNFDITYPVSGSLVKDQIFALVFETLPNGAPASLDFLLSPILHSDDLAADLFFGTEQLGIPIQPGTYTGAEREPFESPGHPGLAISFRNNGCETVSGSFTITDATFMADGTISSFAASFEQYCDGATKADFGTLTYNANATEVPEPAGYWLVGVGMVCLSFRRLQRRSGTLLLFAWFATASVISASPMNFLVNPGFETGDFTSWTVNSGSPNSGVAMGGFQIQGINPNVGSDVVIVHSGQFAAYSLIACGDNTCAPIGLTLSQSISVSQNTEIDAGVYFGNGTAAGCSTCYSFINVNSPNQSTFITVDGTRIPINHDFFNPVSIQPGQYVLFEGTFNSGSRSNVTLSFTMSGGSSTYPSFGPLFQGASFDDFFATPASVPESSTLSTSMLGVGILLLLRLRQH